MAAYLGFSKLRSALASECESQIDIMTTGETATPGLEASSNAARLRAACVGAEAGTMHEEEYWALLSPVRESVLESLAELESPDIQAFFAPSHPGLYERTQGLLRTLLENLETMEDYLNTGNAEDARLGFEDAWQTMSEMAATQPDDLDG